MKLRSLDSNLAQQKAQLAGQQKTKLDEAHKLARIAMAREDPSRAQDIIDRIDEQRERRANKDKGINIAKVAGSAAVGGVLSALAGGVTGDCAVNCSHWHQTPCDGGEGDVVLIPCAIPCVLAEHQSCAGATAAEIAHGEHIGAAIGGVAGALAGGHMAYTSLDLQKQFGYTEGEANMIQEMNEGLRQNRYHA